eukprot:7369182-Prymnesium_polylepis.1
MRREQRASSRASSHAAAPRARRWLNALRTLSVALARGGGAKPGAAQSSAKVNKRSRARAPGTTTSGSRRSARDQARWGRGGMLRRADDACD